MDEPSNIASAAAVHEFLARYLADQEQGEVVPLEDYLALFPGHEREIAREYEELQTGLGRAGESTPLPGRDPPPAGALDAELTGFAAGVFQRLAGREGTSARYERKEEIAHGGQGTIVRVWDGDLQRDLAMKVLRERGEATPGSAPRSDPRSVGRFLEEAQVTGRLDHPGIVPVHELGLDEDGRVYFTMKLVEGRDLKAVFGLVREGREGWTQTRALNVLLKVCEAMAFAHSKGVIHRDLKPANVMVGRFGEVYVMDWGLARVLDRSDRRDVRIRPEAPSAEARSEPDSPLVTMDGDVVGTPAYMSPEQAQGDLEAMGPHSDVYSAGAMLYHLLSGEMPYARSGSRLDNYAVWYQVQKGPPAPLHELAPDTPAELVAICEKAMARDLRARYADMTELAEDLGAYLEHHVVGAYETGAWAEARKWVERNKPLAAAMAAAVLLLVVGLASSWWLKAQSEAKTAQVMRLADARTQQGLMDEAEALWPLDPERIPELESWVARARDLVANLPRHRRTLAQMRERSLPWSVSDRERDRASHPRFPELTRLAGKLDALRWARSIDCGEVEAFGPVHSWELGQDTWDWVGPNRSLFGYEAFGLALARDELGQRDPGNALPRKRLAWALFANGHFEEALAMSEEAFCLVKLDGASEFALDLERLEETLARTRDGSLLAELERDIATLDAEVSARRSWRYEAKGDQWQHDVLVELVADLEALESGLLAEEGLVPGLGPSVPSRLAYTRNVEAGFAEDGEHEVVWSKASAAIHAAYHGLELPPQLGLLPLGQDPRSGLWEFAHLPTGKPAVRRPDGELALTKETGVVLVLLPGGAFWMGAQADDPGGPNYDPEAGSDEGPPHEVELSPFFLSKYEMTQGQWLRIAGRNPSQVNPGMGHGSWLASGEPTSPLHPVESVSWGDCALWLPRVGLALPSEAQWEYAARGGTSTPWWTGAERESLRGAANLCDGFMKAHRWNWVGMEDRPYQLWLDDGSSFHAPVGTYRPNGFGLHDVAGNVWEWCEDGYWETAYRWSARRDPVHSGGRYNLHRGGSFFFDTGDARSARRKPAAGSHMRRNGIGVRPARAVEW